MHRQRQAAEILAIAHQDVEGVELDLGTSRTKEELRLRSGWPPRWLWRGVSRFAGLLLAMGRTLDEALQHAMEAGQRMGASCISPASAIAGGFA